MSQERMTPEALAKFDGREGRPAYVAVSGKVYDVSESPRWQGGEHEGTHHAGRDLTEELKVAPHVRSVIERFPVVAELSDDAMEDVAGKTGPGAWVVIVAAVVIGVVAWIVLKN